MRSVRRSIELNPENPDALYLIGFILGDLGRSEEAAEANRRAVMLNPTLVRAQANLSLETYRHEATPSQQQRTPAGAHITLGRALRQKGYFQEALREYEKAIEGAEANAEVLQAMLELYLLQRDTGAAIATADRFAREFSPTAKTWNGRGVALQLEGRHAEAEESYARALEIDSSYPFAHNNLGVLLWHKNDTKAAINAFRRALQSPAPPVEARLNLALGLFKRKHTELALEAYRQVLSTAPEHPVAWNGIGLILVELEKYADARNAFARAIQANPDFAEAHYNMSFTLSNLGDFAAALRETKRALALDPMYTPQKLELAIELPNEEIRLTVAPPITESAETVEHVEDFHFDPAIIEELFAEKPVRRLTPAAQGAMAGFSLARDLITKGLYDRAQAEIARVLARGGDKILGLVLAGDGFAAQGLHGEALERYRSALQLEETNPYARQGIARSLLALGRPDEARPHAEALVEAGLDSLAGGTLMDLTPDRPHLVGERTAQLERRAPWVAAAAARGLRCEVSWVYGDEDDPQWIIDGLARIRDLQDRWGIFQCFTPLLFQWPSDDVEIPMATGYNQLRAVAVGRLILDNLARVRGSWAALTESMMQVAFWYGADDAGGAVLPSDDLTGTVIRQEQLEELIRGTGRDPIDDLRLTNDD